MPATGRYPCVGGHTYLSAVVMSRGNTLQETSGSLRRTLVLNPLSYLVMTFQALL